MKLKLYGLSEDLDTCSCRVQKEKKPTKRLLEINTMVEELIKENMPESSPKRENKPTPPCKKKKGEKAIHVPNLNQDAKNGLRQHLNRKMSTGGHAPINDGSSFKRATDQGRRERSVQSPPSLDNESDGQLGNPREAASQLYVLGKDNNTQHGIKEGEQIIELSSDQCNILLELFESHGNGTEPVLSTGVPPQSNASAKQEHLSPETSTSNVLERLLRGSDKPSANCSDSNGLEDSTESMII